MFYSMSCNNFTQLSKNYLHMVYGNGRMLMTEMFKLSGKSNFDTVFNQARWLFI